MPPGRSATQPEPTVGDRLISALMGGILGFGTMLLIWLIVMYVGGRIGQDAAMPFYWNAIVGGLAAMGGFIAGPERMMDAFGKVWKLMGWGLFLGPD